MRGLKLVTGILLGVVLCAQLSFLVNGNYVQVAKADYPFGSDSAFPRIDPQTIQALFVQPATANQSLTKELNLADNNCAGENLEGILGQKNSITFPNLICLYGAAGYYLGSGASSGFGLAYSQIGNVIRDFLKDVPNAATATAPTTLFDNSSGTTKFTAAGITDWNLLMGDPSLPVTSDKGGGYISRADAQLATVFKVFQAWQRWENTRDILNSNHEFDADRKDRQFRIDGVPNSVPDPTFSKGQYRPVEFRAWCGGSSVDSELLNGDKDANGNPGGHSDCALTATVDVGYLDWTDDKGLWMDTSGLSSYYDKIVDGSKGMVGGSIAIKGFNVDLTTPSIGTYGDTQFPSSNPAGEPLGSFITGEYKNVTRGLLEAKITVFNQETTLREIATNTGLSPYPLAYKFKLISQNTNGRCGNSSAGLDVVKAIKFAFCGLVDSVESLSLSFLVSSAHLLGKMVNIKPGAQIDDGGLGSFIVGLVPDQLTQGHLDDSLRSQFVGSIAQAILGLIASLTILICLIIALSGIAQFGVNTYSVKKMLPGLLMGFFLAYLAVFAMRAAVELTGNLENFITQSSNNADIQSTGSSELTMDILIQNLAGIAGPSPFSQGLENMSSDGDVPSMTLVFKHGFLAIFLFAAGVMLFILSFLLAIRSLVILVLTCLSPLAFFSSGVGALNNIWSRWWKTASGWLFMPIVVNIWLWVAFRFFIAGTRAGSLGLGTLFNGVVGYGFGLFCIYMAMKTPFTLAGEASGVLNKWNSLGKTAWGKTGGAALGKVRDSAKGEWDRQKFQATYGAKKWASTLGPVSALRERRLRAEKQIADRTKNLETIQKENFDNDQVLKYQDARQKLILRMQNEKDPEKKKGIQAELDNLANTRDYRKNTRALKRKINTEHEDHMWASGKKGLETAVEAGLATADPHHDHAAEHYQHGVELSADIESDATRLGNELKFINRGRVSGVKDWNGTDKIVRDKDGNALYFDGAGNKFTEIKKNGKKVVVDGSGNEVDKTALNLKTKLNEHGMRSQARRRLSADAKLVEQVNASDMAKEEKFAYQSILRAYNGLEPVKKHGSNHVLASMMDNESDEAFRNRREKFKQARRAVSEDIKQGVTGAEPRIKEWDVPDGRYGRILNGNQPDVDDFDTLKDMRDAAIDMLATVKAMDNPKQLNRVQDAAREFLHMQSDIASYDPDALGKLTSIINLPTSSGEQEVKQAVADFKNTMVGRRLSAIDREKHLIYYNLNEGAQPGDEGNKDSLSYAPSNYAGGGPTLEDVSHVL